MVFSSIFFIFAFLPLVIFINLLSSGNIKSQNLLLLFMSIVFYLWGEQNYIWVMFFSIFINFSTGILIDISTKLRHKQILLIFSITCSLMVLGYYKYFDFFIIETNKIFHIDVLLHNVILPLGISFYTFHLISYVMDVYYGKVRAERNILTFSTYVFLFPQLIAGPIVRYSDIYHSFYTRYITRAGFRNGISRFCFGLGKKVLIANTLGPVADYVFNLPYNDLHFFVAWLGAIAYMLQIYFDFSGYSDMAIGIGLMLGFKYKENFNYPYKSQSMQEFWRRWHISLSTWFRDYLYIPLGGSRGSNKRTYCNLVIVFMLCGFWHGASFNFILWGLYNGIFLVLERMYLGQLIKKIPYVFRKSYLWIIVILGWVLFRSNNLDCAVTFYHSLIIPSRLGLTEFKQVFNGCVILAYIFGIILSLGMSDFALNQIKRAKNALFIKSYRYLCNFTAIIVLFLSLLPISNNSYNPFLYFRF